MRNPRFFPFRSFVEVTCQTFQSRFLLTPTPEVCDLILGVLGRALRRYEVEIHAQAFLSNHYHLLLTVRDGEQLARFMGFLNSNIAREIGRLIGWEDKFWSRRYQAILISDEAEAQVSRLRYVLAQGVKEGLVRHPTDWPGVHSAAALLADEPLEGTWYDRTREYAARRTKKGSATTCGTREAVVLSPLPCWRELSPAARKEEVRGLLQQIEDDARAEREATGRPILRAEDIRRQDPFHRPKVRDRSPGPLIHAASRSVRDKFLEAYREFTAAFHQASQRFRSGDRRAIFPEGCFAPSLGWIAPAAATG